MKGSVKKRHDVCDVCEKNFDGLLAACVGEDCGGQTSEFGMAMLPFTEMKL